MLRTTYEVDADGDFAQRVGLELKGHALLSEIASADADAAEATIASAASTGFDLFVDGVLRCVLARVDGERHLLLINVHHVAFDGASTGVMLGELGTLHGVLSYSGAIDDAAATISCKTE